MSQGRFYSIVMPLAGILYVIALVITHNSTVAVIGALLIAVIAIMGRAFRSGR